MRPPIPRPPEDPFDEKPRLKIRYIKDDGGAGPIAIGVVAGLLALAALFSMCSCTTSFEDTDRDTELDTTAEAESPDLEEDSSEDPDIVEDDGGGASDAEEDTEEDTEPVDPCDYYPTWYRDMDMDGWGQNGVTACLPEAPEGYVGRGGDCCDQRSEVNPGADGWHVDSYTCPGESWDWNCDGLEERRWPTASPDPCDPYCGATCHTYETEEECLSHVWWPAAPPACGVSVAATSCLWEGACGAMSGAPTQTCR